MSQMLTIELSDQTYQAIERRAQAAGEPPHQIAISLLEQQLQLCDHASKTMTDAEKEAARRRFESHFGAVDLGYPICGENEELDAALAAEFGSSHEAG